MKIKQLVKEMEEKQPELVIMVGLPGSGKSTIINQRYANHTVVSSDDIIEKAAAEQGLTYDEAFKDNIGRATMGMKIAFKDAVEKNEDIVWDQTNLSKKKRRGILQQIPKHYRTVAVVFILPEKVRAERAAGRTGKSIPDHVMKSMTKNYNPVTKDEGFDKIIEIRN